MKKKFIKKEQTNRIHSSYKERLLLLLIKIVYHMLLDIEECFFFQLAIISVTEAVSTIQRGLQNDRSKFKGLAS